MARIFGTGFERNTLDQFDGSTGTTIVPAEPLNLTGNFACRISDAYRSYLKKALGSYPYLYMSLKINIFNINYNPPIFFYDQNGNIIAKIIINDSFNIDLYRGSTLLATGTSPLSLDTVYQMEIYYLPLNSGGEFTVKIDGVENVTYSGDTTPYLENIGSIDFGFKNTYGGGFYFDDLIIDDSDWIGIGHSIISAPITGAGSSAQWTSSTAATNYANVDEIPYSDTDYNSTNTTDALDLYSISDCFDGIDVASIAGIYFNVRTNYEGVPTVSIKPAIKSGVTVGTYATLSQSVSFSNEQVFIGVNPGTLATFTTSDFTNGIEVGVKAVV